MCDFTLSVHQQNMYDFSKFEDINAFIQRRFNFRVALDDLKNVKHEIIEKIYVTFLNAFNFRADNLNQMPFSASLPDPELHQDIMPRVILVQTISKFLKTMSSNASFHLGDVIQPRPKRTKMLLTQLCQFYLFWEYKMKLYEPIKEENDHNKCLEESLVKSNAEVKVQINQLQYQINDIADRLGSKDDNQEKLKEMNITKGSYKKEKEQWKRHEEELNHRLKSVYQERSMLPEINLQLRQQIKPRVHEINEQIQMYEKDLANWEEKQKIISDKQALLTDMLKLDLVKCKLNECVKASKEVHAHAVHHLDCRGHVIVTQKNTENAKNDILTTEKNLQQKEEMFNMLKGRKEKELWRRQGQYDEVKNRFQQKEELVHKDEPVKPSYERDAVLQKMVTQMEDKSQNIEKSFLSAVKYIMDCVKADHEEQAKYVDQVLNI